MSDKQAAAGFLKQYLEQRQVRGQSHVGLRPGLLDKLAGRSGKARGNGAPEMRRAGVAPSPGAAFPDIQGARQPGGPSGNSSRGASPAAAASAAMFRETLVGGGSTSSMPEPVKTAAPLRPAPASPAAFGGHASASPGLIEVPGNTKAEKLAALAALAEQSPEARALGTLRPTMVFAVGNPEAEIMFIGEAPGMEEERQQEPFVGPAGQKLTGIIKAMGLDRSEIYISNICKFRPAMENQGSGNRPPTALEMRTCLSYVLTEIAIIQPKILVALGKTAAEGLGLNGPVSKLRGQFYPVQGLPTMVTYHPSYILREEKMADGGRVAKRQVWEDMLQVMEKAGLPISDKQRAYFKK